MAEEKKTILLNGGREVSVTLVTKAHDFLTQLLGDASTKSGLATLQVVKNTAGKPFVAVLIGGKHVGFLSDSDAQHLFSTLAEYDQLSVVAQAKGTVTAAPDGWGKAVMKLSLAEPSQLMSAQRSGAHAQPVEPSRAQAAQPTRVQEVNAAVASGTSNRGSEESSTDPSSSPQTVVQCANCGTNNASGSRFCLACGLPLEGVPSVVSQPSETTSTGRPADAGENPGRESPPNSDDNWAPPDVRTLASAQKLVLFGILLYLIVVAVVVIMAASGGATGFGTTATSLLSLATLVVSLAGVYRLAAALGEGVGGRVAYIVLMFVPLVGLVALVWLDSRATSRLRDAGLKVGLLGVRRPDGRFSWLRKWWSRSAAHKVGILVVGVLVLGGVAAGAWFFTTEYLLGKDFAKMSTEEVHDFLIEEVHDELAQKYPGMDIRDLMGERTVGGGYEGIATGRKDGEPVTLFVSLSKTTGGWSWLATMDPAAMPTERVHDYLLTEVRNQLAWRYPGTDIQELTIHQAADEDYEGTATGYQNGEPVTYSVSVSYYEMLGLSWYAIRQ